MRYALLTAFVLTLSFPLNAHADKAATLIDNINLAQKLENIAAPVLMNNPELCGSFKRPYLGAEFMTQDGVGDSYKPLVKEHFGVGMHPTITIIGKSSPAESALKKGDVITAVNGQNLAEGNDGQYALEDAIAAGGALNLTVVRGAAEKSVSVTPASVCGARARLATTDENKIYAEEGKVFVSRGALRGMSDAALSSELKMQLARYKQ